MYQVKSSAKINVGPNIVVFKGILLPEMRMPSKCWWFIYSVKSLRAGFKTLNAPVCDVEGFLLGRSQDLPNLRTE